MPTGFGPTGFGPTGFGPTGSKVLDGALEHKVSIST